MIVHLLKYEWLCFRRQRHNLALLLFAVLLGIYAIYCGNREMNKQKRTLASVAQQEQKAQQSLINGFSADTTTQAGKQTWELSAVPSFGWHRHTYAVSFAPAALSSLAIGQRDLQPYYYALTGMSLYYQVFQNEIANPELLLTGNTDLAFVLVYLFPLLIIAFCYPILSSDIDRGVFPLIRSQAISVKQLVLCRLLFYFLLLNGTAILLSLAGCLADGLSFRSYGLACWWILVLMAYFLFWFSWMFLLIALNQNSVWNAMAGIASWLSFLILIPAVLTIAISIYSPLNPSVLSGISRRSGVFDEEKEENHIRVIREFLKKHPQYDTGASVFQKKLMAKGHAAFTVLRDEQSEKLVNRYQIQVSQRDALARSLNFINPAVNTQNLFSTLASSNLYAFQDFNRAVSAFHKRLVAFYYTKLFSDQHFNPMDLRQRPVFAFKRSRPLVPDVQKGVAQLGMLSLLVLLGANFIANRRVR